MTKNPTQSGIEGPDFSCNGSLGEALGYASKGELTPLERFHALDACSVVSDQVSGALDALSVSAGSPSCDNVSMQQALELLSSITRLNNDLISHFNKVADKQ